MICPVLLEWELRNGLKNWYRVQQSRMWEPEYNLCALLDKYYKLPLSSFSLETGGQMQSEKSLRYPNLRKGLLSKYKHYSLISKLIQNIFYTLHITPVKIIRTYYIKKMLNFNIFRMSNKKNKKVLIMA